MNSPETVSLAVARYLGFGVASHPDEKVERLVTEFGNQLALELEIIVKNILEELNSLNVDWATHSLVEAGAWAKEEMHRRHPDLSEEALRSLEWAFTWWWH